jgi:hypothetical protein
MVMDVSSPHTGSIVGVGVSTGIGVSVGVGSTVSKISSVGVRVLEVRGSAVKVGRSKGSSSGVSMLKYRYQPTTFTMTNNARIIPILIGDLLIDSSMKYLLYPFLTSRYLIIKG